jgi:hypothetical protein
MVMKDDNKSEKVKVAEAALWNMLSESEKVAYEEKAKQSNMYGHAPFLFLLTAHFVYSNRNLVVGTLESVVQDRCHSGCVQIGLEFHVKAAWQDASGVLETKMYIVISD